MTDRPAASRVLFRHFLHQFVSFEATATGGEAKHAIVAVVSLLAAPGYLSAIAAARGSRATYLAKQGRVAPSLWLWREEWLLFSVSLVVVAVVVALCWRALVLGPRDHRILGVLPLRRTTVVRAKLASVAAVVLLLHAAINTLPGLWLPVASPLGYLRCAAALQLALLAQTVFVVATIVAVQGLFALVLPERARDRVSAAVQAAVLLAAAILFLAEGAVSRLAFAVRDEAHVVNAIVPVVWFRALYLRLAGMTIEPIVAVPCTFLGFRETRRGEAPTGAGRRRLLPAWFEPRLPLARATCSFVQTALWRSGSAGLIARGWFFVGVALSLNGLVGLYLQDQGRSAPQIPTAPVFAPVFVLPFFALVGLRLAASFPTCLEANWVFRLTEEPGAPAYAAGVRRAAVRVAVVPVLLALAPAYAVGLGLARAALLLALALAVALTTVEWLFLGFPKIPFTCTYLPGGANLRLTWPKHVAVFLVYCAALPAASARLLGHPGSGLAVLGLLIAAWAALRRAGQRRRPPALVFDQKAPAGVTQLGLEWRALADLR
jgi:hypothetical protein